MTTLIVFGGLPGAGKTAIAQELACELGAVYLRIDSIEQAIRASGILDKPLEDEGFRKLRAYRNKSITHWDASDSHLVTTWDGINLTIQRGFVGDRAELERRTAAGEFEFQMTVPLPGLYDLVDTYAATVQEFLESNAAKFVGN